MTNERYEWIKAIRSSEELRWEYRLEGAARDGRQDHDEDVSDYTDKQIIELTASMLDVRDDNRDVIQIENE